MLIIIKLVLLRPPSALAESSKPDFIFVARATTEIVQVCDTDPFNTKLFVCSVVEFLHFTASRHYSSLCGCPAYTSIWSGLPSVEPTFGIQALLWFLLAGAVAKNYQQMQVLLLQFIFLVFNLDASMSSSKTLSTDQVKIWAETLGITNLSEDAAEFISSAVSQKVHAIVDRASKTANSSCRMKILKSDVESAMQFLNLEPTVDISTGDYIPIRGVSGVGGRTLYVIDDKDKDLFSITKRHSGPVPPDVVLRQHWLAVEGKQPAVPENPAPISKDEQKSRASNPAIARKVATERAIRKSQMIGIKDLATSDLTAEQQQYYKDITEAVIGSDENKRREALSSLEHDPGLHALVARIAVFISGAYLAFKY